MTTRQNFPAHFRKSISQLPIFLAALFFLVAGVPAQANLVIVPTWDSTITSDPNAAIIENTITNLIAVYQRAFLIRLRSQ